MPSVSLSREIGSERGASGYFAVVRMHLTNNMKFGKADLDSRLARKSVYRHAAKLLEAAFKTNDEDKIPHVQQLIAEMKRRGKMSRCLIEAVEERNRYENSPRYLQKKKEISKEKDG